MIRTMDQSGKYVMVKRFESRAQDVSFTESGSVQNLGEVIQTGNSQDFSFFLCGHSLGGGLATLFALRLMEEYGFDPDSIVIYTFGAPPVAAAMVNDHHTTAGNRGGLPTLPFASIGLKHLGTEFQFNPRTIPGFQEIYKQRFKRPYSPKKLVDAHMMAGYGIGTEQLLGLLNKRGVGRFSP